MFFDYIICPLQGCVPMIIPRRSNGRRETVEANSPLSRVAVHAAEDEVDAKVGD